MDIKNKQNDAPAKGQGSQLDKGNNPSGVASLKGTRKTNENSAGTAYLRGQQMGNNK